MGVGVGVDSLGVVVGPIVPDTLVVPARSHEISLL